MSSECKSFIKTLLRRRPASRATIPKALKDPWIAELARNVQKEAPPEGVYSGTVVEVQKSPASKIPKPSLRPAARSVQHAYVVVG